MSHRKEGSSQIRAWKTQHSSPVSHDVDLDHNLNSKKGQLNKYAKNHNQNKYQNNQQDYYSNEGSQMQYESQYHYGGYSTNSKGSYHHNSPSKKYDRMQTDYHTHHQSQGGNMQRTMMNDDNSYNTGQKDVPKYNKYRNSKNVQTKHKQDYEFNNHYQTGFQGGGGYENHHYGASVGNRFGANDHREHGYGQFDQQPQMAKGKQGGGGYTNQTYQNNEYYYEEDYYNDYQEPMNNMKNVNSGNKYHSNKYYSNNGYQKHHSDRKPVSSMQYSMNTNKSYSSGSQEGRKKQTEIARKCSQIFVTQDQYQYCNTQVFSKQLQQTGNQKYTEPEYHQDDYSHVHPNKNTSQYSQGQANNTRIRRQYICKVCKIELKDFEKEFYPCNCKYSLCYSCYYHQVEHKGRKCPNCGKHYEVNRVEEYKQSRMVTAQQEPNHTSVKVTPSKKEEGYGKLIQESKHNQYNKHCIDYKMNLHNSHQYVPKKQVNQNTTQISDIKQADQNQIYQQKIQKEEPIKQSFMNQPIIMGQVPLIAIDIPNQPKIIKTDEDIPFEPSNLIGLKQIQQLNDDNEQTVQQKYDLVSINSGKQEDLEQNLQKCNFQKVTGPEPEDSECPIDIVSMRSTQTQNFNPKSNQHVMRRMNSQENIITTLSQFPNQTTSNGGFTMSLTNHKSSEQKERIQLAIKGIKLSKIRIIQKATVYVIGLSPSLADESLIRRYEYFGQYGKILQVAINKDNAFTSSVKDDVGGESTSSTKSQISYAAYITYSSPQDAALAIMALDQCMYDQRLIRASYGRTKYCKYFLKNSRCPNKDCPYKHSESKEQDILTPDDMQKKALFQYCIQLSIQMSKIAEMNESQFKNLLKHKRDLRNLNVTTKHVLPSIESIFDNNDLLKKINQFKTSLLSAKSKQKAEDKSKLLATELSKKQLQTAANKVSRELRYQNSILDKKATKGQDQNVKKPRSGSNNQNEIKQSKTNLIELEQIKAQERQSLTPRRHSISRMFSQYNAEIKIQDLKNQHNNIALAPEKQFGQTLMEKPKTKVTQKNTKNLQDGNQNNQLPAQRTNRLMSKDEGDTVKEATNKTVTEKKESPSLGRNNRGRFSSYRRDRQKSASKSIQRQTSVSSLIDYTLKFLNDDMAIDLTKLRIEDPLIEKSVEEDDPENESQINRMIFQNQYQNQDQFDGKSSIFSNGVDSRGNGAMGQLLRPSWPNGGHLQPEQPMGEINLRKINNIYTSPFFLINYERDEIDKNESIYKIWENFDKIDNALNLQNQNSDYKYFQQKFDTHSYEEYGIRHNTLNYSSHMSINENNNLGFFGALQTKPQLHQQQSMLNIYKQAQPMTSSLTLNAKPFLKTNNSLHSGSQAAGTTQKQSTAANSGPGGGNTQSNFQNTPKLVQYRPKKLNSAMQQANSNTPQQKSQNQITKCKELNVKNLYLFDKQQDELFDKQQHWNKIFLNKDKVIKTNTNSGQKSELFNSQSVFCFPMGVQDDKEIKKIKQSTSKDNFNLSDQKQRHSFGLKHQLKRKSTLCINTQYTSPRYVNELNCPEGQQTLMPLKLSQNALQNNPLVQQSGNLKRRNENTGTNRSHQKPQQDHTRNTISDTLNTKENEFDRKSAGNRFGCHGNSFYQELQKINSLFNSTALRRRKSCSHSQSHSRVRINEEVKIILNNNNELSLRKQETTLRMNKKSPSSTSESLFVQAVDAIQQSHKQNQNTFCD